MQFTSASCLMGIDPPVCGDNRLLAAKIVASFSITSIGARQWLWIFLVNANCRAQTVSFRVGVSAADSLRCALAPYSGDVSSCRAPVRLCFGPPKWSRFHAVF
jgi:hypothetical protein